jgi:hypothetical protein
MKNAESIEVIIYILAVVVGIIIHVFKKTMKKHQETDQTPATDEADEILITIPTTPPPTAKTSKKTKSTPKPPAHAPKQRGQDLEASWIKTIEKQQKSSRTTTEDFDYTPEDLTSQARTGIIWSEIFQPPVGMRG